MKAILCKELTGYKNLTLEDSPEPTLKSGEVLVEVEITALNFFDTLITKGQYQFKPDLPFAPGGEIAGRVNAVADDVSGFNRGDRVMAYIGWGGCQQLVAVKASDLIHIPDAISSKEAASLIITYGTAMHGLVDRANLKAGQNIAILGAGGGAGLAAVEIAKALGATIIAVASSNEKCELAQSQGAQMALNVTNEDLKTGLKQLTKGEGVDVVYDCVGGDLAEPALRTVKWNGRYLVVGFASGEIPAIPLNLIMLKGINVQGVFFGRFLEQQREDFQAHISQLLNWVEAGVLTPHVSAVYPLAETVNAIEVLANRKARGKILIDVTA